MDKDLEKKLVSREFAGRIDLLNNQKKVDKLGKTLGDESESSRSVFQGECAKKTRKRWQAAHARGAKKTESSDLAARSITGRETSPSRRNTKKSLNDILPQKKSGGSHEGGVISTTP